jgi:flagellar biogenesis protein FliO
LSAEDALFLQGVTDAQINALHDMRVELHKHNNTNQINQTT